MIIIKRQIHFSSESLVEKLKDEDLKFQDTSISLWQINNFLKSKKLSNKQKIKNLVCQHRANSFVLQFEIHFTRLF